MIIGNQKQQEFLKELMEKEKRGTVLVFGPEGVGKFSFLKEYLSSQKDTEKIFLTTQEKNFKIDSARFLTILSQRKVTRRIVVINDAHKFQIEAQNTLLKTLEESPSQTLFLLVTHKLYKILPTIRSRSILVRFNLVPQEEVFQFLKSKKYKTEDILNVLEFYPCQPGKALYLLENLHKLKLFKKFLSSSLENKFSLIEELKKSFTLQEFLELYLMNERKKIKENQKNKLSLEKIKEILALYFDSDYNLNFEIQLTPLILNYG